MATPWYDPSAHHVDVQTLPYSADLPAEAFDRLMKSFHLGKLTPKPDQKMMDHYTDIYQIDTPLREYVGFVWRSKEAEELGMADVPKIQFRVMARAGISAKSAVIAHFGEEYASSLWNEEDRKRKR